MDHYTATPETKFDCTFGIESGTGSASSVGSLDLVARIPGSQSRVHRTYVGGLERGESGVTVQALAAILAAARFVHR